MPDKQPSLFISYSRTDSEFVDRLQADLQSRGYDTWVDRKRLEGGQDWADMIQRAIERCQIMLIALSPEAITSEWVKREIAYAQESGKQLLPLMVRHVTQVPIRIQGIQWVDCEGPYERALDRLLFTLTLPVVAPTPAPTIQPAPIPPVPTIEEPQSTDEDLVVARQGPPPPDPNLNALYTAGVEARANGNLELASVYWQQIVDRDPEFGNGIAATQLESLLTQQLRPLRLQRLREQAQSAMAEGDYRRATGAWQAMLAIAPDDADIKRGMRAALKARAIQAQRKGEWGEEIGAWEAMRRFDPQDPEPSERITIAEQNQQWAWLYTNAQNFAVENKLTPAKDALETLWNKAPYFGDPASIAAIVGATPPPTYEQARTEQARKRQEQSKQEAQRRVQEARNQRRQRKPDFLKKQMGTNTIMFSTWTLLSLVGMGIMVDVIAKGFALLGAASSANSLFTVTAVSVFGFALLLYWINYSRALDFLPLLGLAGVATAVAYVGAESALVTGLRASLGVPFVVGSLMSVSFGWFQGAASSGSFLRESPLGCLLYFSVPMSLAGGAVVCFSTGLTQENDWGAYWGICLMLLTGFWVGLLIYFYLWSMVKRFISAFNSFFVMVVIVSLAMIVIGSAIASGSGATPVVLGVIIPAHFMGAGLGSAMGMTDIQTPSV